MVRNHKDYVFTEFPQKSANLLYFNPKWKEDHKNFCKQYIKKKNKKTSKKIN